MTPLNDQRYTYDPDLTAAFLDALAGDPLTLLEIIANNPGLRMRSDTCECGQGIEIEVYRLKTPEEVRKDEEKANHLKALRDMLERDWQTTQTARNP